MTVDLSWSTKRRSARRLDGAARERASALLHELVGPVRGITGALVATLDGYSVASASVHNEAAAAAIVASSRGLAERLTDLCGGGALHELVVRSSHGYVVVYAVGNHGALTVTTDDSANLALIHLQAREVLADLVDVFADFSAEAPDDSDTEGIGR